MNPSAGQRPWLGPVLTVSALYLGLMALYLLPFRGELSALVCLNEKLRGQAPFEAIRAGFTPQGYDGQFYYALAQNPWKERREAIDFPSYRHARLLYPALAWLFSGGDPCVLLWVMPLLNLMAVAGTAWLGTLFATHYGRSPWWGLLLPVAVNAIMPAFRNLTDPLAAVAVVGLIAAWFLAWPTWTLIGWGTACVLSREQNIAIVAIVGVDALLSRQWRRSAGLAIAAAVWVAWMIVLKTVYGHWPNAPINSDGPFEGMWYRWSHLEGSAGMLSVPAHLARMGLLTAQLAVAGVVVFRGERVTGLVALAALGLASIAGRVIYNDAFSYCRVLNWAPLSVWLWTVQSGRRWPVFLLAPAVGWPLIEIVKVCR